MQGLNVKGRSVVGYRNIRWGTLAQTSKSHEKKEKMSAWFFLLLFVNLIVTADVNRDDLVVPDDQLQGDPVTYAD